MSRFIAQFRICEFHDPLKVERPVYHFEGDHRFVDVAVKVIERSELIQPRIVGLVLLEHAPDAQPLFHPEDITDQPL